MELGQYRAAVLRTVFETAEIGETVDWFEFPLAGNFDGKFVVASAAVGAAGEHILFNLPTYSTDVFVGLTDKSPKDVALILANLEDYERENHLKLSLGEAVVLPNNKIGPFAILLLRTSTLADVAGIPDTAVIAGQPTAFLLAVPLIKEEYELRASEGHDALIEHFKRTGKSLAF